MVSNRIKKLLVGISIVVGAVWSSQASAMDIITIKLQGKEMELSRALAWYDTMFLPTIGECQEMKCFPSDQEQQVASDNTGIIGCMQQESGGACNSVTGTIIPTVFHPDFNGP